MMTTIHAMPTIARERSTLPRRSHSRGDDGQRRPEAWPWLRMNRLVTRYLPQPKDRHPYPKDRFALDLRQEPYEGVLHVRICAGGRR